MQWGRVHQCISASLNLLHLRSTTSKTPLSYILSLQKHSVRCNQLTFSIALKCNATHYQVLQCSAAWWTLNMGCTKYFPLHHAGWWKLSSFGVNCRLMLGVDSTLLSNEVCVELLWCAVELDHLGVQKRITKALVCSRDVDQLSSEDTGIIWWPPSLLSSQVRCQNIQGWS